MALRKAIATRPGQPTRYINLTPAEKAARDANEAEVAAAKPAKLRAGKTAAFIEEGVKRIAAQVPDWDTLDAIKTAAGMWPAISANATPEQVAAKDIYLFVRDTVPLKLAALSIEAELDAVDPTLADPFGDGTVWPA